MTRIHAPKQHLTYLGDQTCPNSTDSLLIFLLTLNHKRNGGPVMNDSKTFDMMLSPSGT